MAKPHPSDGPATLRLPLFGKTRGAGRGVLLSILLRLRIRVSTPAVLAFPLEAVHILMLQVMRPSHSPMGLLEVTTNTSLPASSL